MADPIPPAAVEAAVDVICEAHGWTREEARAYDADPDVKVPLLPGYEEDAREVLEAALPHLHGGHLELDDGELNWLLGAVVVASRDRIAEGLGPRPELEDLAAKLRAELGRRQG